MSTRLNLKYANNATTTISSVVAAGDTTINVTSLTPFPSVDQTLDGSCMYVTLIRNSDGAIEIIKVGQTAGGQFRLVQRGQQGTTALAFAVGDKAELRVTKEGMENFLWYVNGEYLATYQYTPADSGTVFAAGSPGELKYIIEIVGGGGSSGSVAATGTGELAASSGGSGGGYARLVVPASSLIGATLTIGSGGAAPALGSSGNPGGQSKIIDYASVNMVTCSGGGYSGFGPPYTTSSLLSTPAQPGGTVTTSYGLGAFMQRRPGGTGSPSIIVSNGGTGYMGAGGTTGMCAEYCSALYGAGGHGLISTGSTVAQQGIAGGDGFILIHAFGQSQ